MRNDKLLFKYYEIFSEAWYDDKDNVKFARKEDAIEYAKSSTGYFPPYGLYEISLLELEDGTVEEKSNFIGKIPNQKVRTVEYYVSCYVDGKPKQHKVTVNLNDNNKLDYIYEYADKDEVLLKRTR